MSLDVECQRLKPRGWLENSRRNLDFLSWVNFSSRLNWAGKLAHKLRWALSWNLGLILVMEGSMVLVDGFTRRRYCQSRQCWSPLLCQQI